MQINIEFGGDAVTQVSTAPAHHAIGLEVRAVFYPLRYFAPLASVRRADAQAGPVRQPSQAIRVVAMHPVAQRLPSMHRPAPNIRECPSSTMQCQNAPPCCVSRPRRLRPQRLCARYRRMLARGKKKTIVITAIARELVGFIWAIGSQIAEAGTSPRGSETSRLINPTHAARPSTRRKRGVYRSIQLTASPRTRKSSAR